MAGGIGFLKRFISVFFLLLMLTAMIFTAVLSKREYAGYYIKNGAELSEEIRTALKNRSFRITISFEARASDAESVKETVDKLLEGALYESDDPKGGDYIRYQLGGYEMDYRVEGTPFGYSYTARLKPTYYTNRDEENYVDKEVSKIVSSLGELNGEAEKVRAVHDYVTSLLSYDSVHKKNEGNHKKTTAYSALKYHRAVCQGYAVLTYRLLKELGLNCRIVTGDAVVFGNTERHAWLVVEVDGRELGLDPTLDDVNDSYDWYLKPLSEFEKDHVPD